MLNLVKPPEIPRCAWQRSLGQGWEKPYRAADELTIDDGPWQGMPLGGFGGGNIGRSPRGEFNLWQLDGGEHVFHALNACQFSIFEQPEQGPAQVYALCTDPPADGSLSRWAWYPANQGTYAALYPRSWYRYDGVFNTTIICEQFSPIWPENYQECSYPLAVFDWYLHNPTDQPITISVLMTWQNMLGWFRPVSNGQPHTARNYQPRWGESTGNYNQWILDRHRVGFLFDRVQPHDQLQEGEGQVAIASSANPSLEVFYLGRWNPTGDGSEVWEHFAADGSLPDQEDETPAAPGEQVAAAMAIRLTLRPGRSRHIPFILSWDLPITEFAQGVTYYRRYTDFFGRSGTNAWSMVRTALKHSDMWKERIQGWQKGLWQQPQGSEALHMALCNELAQLGTGGTLWTAATERDPVGQFATLESLRHRYYESLDVRLYSSFALAHLWPRLDQAVLEAFARNIVAAGDLKDQLSDLIPHDLGTPFGHPWQQTNAAYQDRSLALQGRLDLSCAFILQVYRAFEIADLAGIDFLWECWPAIAATLNYWQSFPTDPQGLPASPDRRSPQFGDSDAAYPLYQGGLWIAALSAAIAIAQQLQTRPPFNPQLLIEDVAPILAAAIDRCQAWLEQSRSGYPTSQDLGILDNTIEPWKFALTLTVVGDHEVGFGQSFAEALCGPFYARYLNLPDIPLPAAITTLLATLANSPPQLPITVTSPQSDGLEKGNDTTLGQSILHLGHAWGLAANLVQQGYSAQALQLTELLIQIIYNQGLQFRTPAMFLTQQRFQASHALSSLSIWSLYSAKIKGQKSKVDG